MARNLRELDEWLDNFEKQVGLDKITIAENEHRINTYLNYEWEDIQKTDAHGCAIMHFEISTFLFKMQRIINRLDVKMKYADGEQKKEIGAKLDRLKYLNFPLKNLLKSLELLHDSKQLEKKEEYYEQKRNIHLSGSQREEEQSEKNKV